MGPRAAPAVVQAFREHPIFRRNGAVMVGALGGPVALQVLVEAVRDPHRAVRLAAEEGLQILGGSAVEPLLHLLRDTHEIAHEHIVRW
jgi:HEAT repeat protein